MTNEQKSSSYTNLDGENIQPGRELSASQKVLAFSTALEFAGNLVEAKLKKPESMTYVDRSDLIKHPKYEEQPQKVRDYLRGVVLGRLSLFYEEAVDKNIPLADSLGQFADLRKALCQKVSLCEEDMPDKLIESLIREQSTQYLEGFIDDMDRRSVEYVQIVARIVVPKNPPAPQVERRVSQQAID